MLEIEEIKVNNSEEWDSLVERYPKCTLFHTFFWAQVIEKTYGIKGHLLQFWDRDKPVGIIPIWVTKKAGLTLVGSPLRQTATHFCGPLLNENININDALEALYLYASKKLKASYVDITLPYSLDVNISKYWNISKPDTLIVDLNRTEDEIWKSFEGRMRTAVRKAQKSGVQVKIIKCSNNEIEIFYNMLEKVHSRRGIKPIFPKFFYKNLLIHQSPYAFLYGARFEGQWIAMTLILKYRDWMNYHSAALLREFGKLGANNLIQWQVIRDGLKEEKKIYDLGGGSGIEGIEKFKKSMRPYRSYYQNMWRANMFARLARFSYEKLLPLIRKI